MTTLTLNWYIHSEKMKTILSFCWEKKSRVMASSQWITSPFSLLMDRQQVPGREGISMHDHGSIIEHSLDPLFPSGMNKKRRPVRSISAYRRSIQKSPTTTELANPSSTVIYCPVFFFCLLLIEIIS